jgi:hypothetical protein
VISHHFAAPASKAETVPGDFSPLRRAGEQSALNVSAAKW